MTCLRFPGVEGEELGSDNSESPGPWGGVPSWGCQSQAVTHENVFAQGGGASSLGRNTFYIIALNALIYIETKITLLCGTDYLLYLKLLSHDSLN